MSVATEIERIQNAKYSIKTAIENKGVVVGDSTIDTYASKIDEITAGGSDLEINNCAYLFYSGARVEQLYDILKICKNVTTCEQMFYQFKVNNYTTLDLSNFDTSKVITMNNMFANASNITEINLTGKFKTDNVTNMQNMFRYCSNISNIDLSNFNTSKVTTMQWMFYSCVGLTELDLSNFDTSNVTNNANMFYGCSKLEKLIINNPNVFKMTSTNMLTNTPIAKGTGYIYVPDDLVETYKTATNWSTYADQIKGMSELI